MINKQLINLSSPASSGGNAGEEGLMIHLDASDVDSYDGDGSEWVDITNHEYKPTTDVSEHFNTVIWTGDGATSRNITGVGFDPDLVWIKKRTNDTKSHRLFNTLRGANKVLYSNSNAAEGSPTTELTAFITDGFTLGNQSAVNDGAAGDTYVAWCFKAGGAPTVNNSGGQTPTSGSKMVDDSTVTDAYPTADIYPTKQSVNTKLGFSVTEYTGAGSGKTLPHGLDVPPEMYIVKTTSGTGHWWVYTTEGGDFQYLKLNETDAGVDADQYYDRPTAGLIEQGQGLNSDNVMYTFASKRGVSKVGSFIGTGSAGNKVYTGFEPAFILTKRSSSSGAGWTIIDNKRSTDSDKNDYLYANTNGTEATSTSGITFNRDGFTFNGASFNTSGAKHIYYAVAKSTNETDLIDDTDLELHLDADSFPEKGESGYSNTPSTWTALTGSNGTISGATFDSESGNYLNFDGSGDTVTIGTQSYFHSTNDFTAELWVKRTTTNEDTIFRLGTEHPTYYLLYNDSVGFWFNDYTSSPRRETRTGAVPETLNQWTHITLVVDGGNIAPKIYINGEHKSILANGANGGTSGNKDLIIGQGYPAALWGDWQGAIGQVRWYGSKLTDAQIRQNYNFTKNDYPNGFDATISGASFHPDGYLEFNGSSHFAYIDSTTNSSPVDFSKKNYSIAAWVNLDNVNTPNYVLSKYGTSDSVRSIIFGVNNNGTLRLLERSSSTNNQSSTGVLTSGTWHHIAVVRTFDKISFYINGSLDTEISSSFTPNDGGNQRITIGKHESSTPLYFDGKMSDIKLYDKALTSSEVASQFAIKQFQIG